MNRVELPVDRARTLTLVAAAEAVDTSGAWLPVEAREEATRAARDRLPEDANAAQVAETIAARAEALLPRLAERSPRVARLDRGIPLGRLVLLAILLPAVYGLGRSALGPGSVIDIFANPLVLLVLWNFVVCSVGLLRLLARFVVPPTADETAAAETSTTDAPAAPNSKDAEPRKARSWLATRLGEWLLLLGVGGRTLRSADHAELAARVAARYADDWRVLARERTTATAQILLHTSATLLVATAVAEAYLRGLFTEYSAQWQSTWLDETGANDLAAALYSLPTRILDLPLVLPAESTPVDAGPWIHRMAVAALVYAVLPRLILISSALRRRARSSRVSVAIDPALARRLRARASTAFARVAVTPYSCVLPEGGPDRLRRILVEVLGERAVIELGETAGYGDEPDIGNSSNGADPSSGSGDLCRVVLFGLAQPPETEVHGDYLERLAADGSPTIALIDASGYRRRLGDEPAGRERVAERRRAWDRVLGGGKDARGRRVPVVHIDLSEELDDHEFGRLGAAVAAASGKEAKR